MTGEYMTPAEVAARWNVSTRQVHRMVARGELSHLRVGRTVRILDRTVRQFEDSHTQRARSSRADR